MTEKTAMSEPPKLWNGISHEQAEFQRNGRVTEGQISPENSTSPSELSPLPTTTKQIAKCSEDGVCTQTESDAVRSTGQPLDDR